MLRAILFMSLVGLTACSNEAKQRLITDPAIATRANTALATGPSRDASLALAGAGANPVLTSRVIRNRAVEAELSRILNRLTQNWTATSRPPVQLVLVADRTYGASASSANVIQIHLGVIERAETEDEIAFVLAHEYAHVLIGHIQENARATRNMRTTTAGGLVVFRHGLALTARNRPISNQTQQTAYRASLMGANLLLAVTDEFLATRWSREQETEADRLGFDLMATSRYSPGAYSPVFTQLQAAAQGRAERAAQLRNTFAGTGSWMASLLGGGVGGVGGQAISTGGVLMGATVDRAFGYALAGLTGTHDDPTQRQDDLNKYTGAFWADASAEAADSPFRRGAPQAQLARIVRVEDALAEARTAIDQGRFDDAQRMLTLGRGRAGEIQAVAPSGWRQARAQLALAQGDFQGAIRELTAAEALPDPNATIFNELAWSFMEVGRPVDALAVLDRAERRFGTAEPFMALRLRALRAARREAQFQELVGHCQAQMSSDVARDCSDVAAEGPPSSPSVTTGRSGATRAVPTPSLPIAARLRPPG